MNNYRYQLEKYHGRNSRYTCPQCGKAHRFTRYIDTETGLHLADHVGRCNREVECGYHYKPKEFLSPESKVVRHESHRFSPGSRNTLTTHDSLLMTDHTLTTALPATLVDYDRNHLITYLSGKLGGAATEQLIARYRIGTHHHWPGSTVYWYINRAQQPCSGKVMLYHPTTGRRVKEPYSHVTWMHSLLGMEGFVRQPCFFGEHLLADTTQPVCMVESEKTALVAAHLLPGSIWLATGGLSQLNMAHCRSVLRGRKLTLFPDAGAYDKWQPIAAQLPHCNISRIVEQYHSLPGDDLADMLV